MEMYCRHCKGKQETKDIEKKDSSKGKYAQGKCVICGNTTIRKLKKEDW